MRLGTYACALKPGSLAHELYGADVIHERHRHRYEFNCLYEKALTDKGLEIVGRSLDGKFVEILELPVAPVVRRGAVPSRVQVEAAQAAPAVRRVRRGEPRRTRWPRAQQTPPRPVAGERRDAGSVRGADRRRRRAAAPDRRARA